MTYLQVLRIHELKLLILTKTDVILGLQRLSLATFVVCFANCLDPDQVR